MTKIIHQQRVNEREVLTIREPDSPDCEVHDWPTGGLAQRLVAEMRARHPKGVNACTECITRARADVRERLHGKA